MILRRKRFYGILYCVVDSRLREFKSLAYTPETPSGRACPRDTDVVAILNRLHSHSPVRLGLPDLRKWMPLIWSTFDNAVYLRCHLFFLIF